MSSRFERLYVDGKHRQLRIKRLQSLAKVEREREEHAQCTFHPVLHREDRSPAASSADVLGGEDVFLRLAAPKVRSPADGTRSEVFRPSVNHNMDAQLRQWAHAVGVHERLYGEALCRRDRSARSSSPESHGTAAHIDPHRVDELFEDLYHEVNTDSDDHGSTCRGSATSFVGLYLEPPQAKELRLSALRSKYTESFSFSPSITTRPITPPLSRPVQRRSNSGAAMSNQDINKLGREIAREAMKRPKLSTLQNPTLCRSKEFARRMQEEEMSTHHSELKLAVEQSRASWHRGKSLHLRN